MASFYFHYARLIEILAATEKIEALLADADMHADHLRASAGINRLEAVGVSEAPRGTLFHHYQVDKDGLLTHVNLIIATGQNNLAMNRTIAQIAKQYIRGPTDTRGGVQPRRGRHPRLRPVPELFDARLRPDAAHRATARLPRGIASRGSPRMTPSIPTRSASKATTLVLVIGYGNELRSDDGVGPQIARSIAAQNLADVQAIAVDQLVPELSESLSAATLAIFVDAACNPGDGVALCRLEAAVLPPGLGHICDPQALLAMTQAIFGRCPDAWLLTIPAENLAFGEALSPTTTRAAAGALLDIPRLIAEHRHTTPLPPSRNTGARG